METNFQFFFNLLEQKHENFIAAVRKWEMVEATKVKMGGSEEQVNRNKHSISSIKRVTGKYRKNSRYFVGVFNKAIIALALVWMWNDYSQRALVE